MKNANEIPVGIEFVHAPGCTKVKCVECEAVATIDKFKAEPYWCDDCVDFHIKCPFCGQLMPSVYVLT